MAQKRRKKRSTGRKNNKQKVPAMAFINIVGAFFGVYFL